MMTYEDKIEASVRLAIRNAYESIIHTHDGIRDKHPWIFRLLTWHLRHCFRRELKKNTKLQQRCQEAGLNYRHIYREETPWP